MKDNHGIAKMGSDSFDDDVMVWYQMEWMFQQLSHSGANMSELSLTTEISTLIFHLRRTPLTSQTFLN